MGKENLTFRDIKIDKNKCYRYGSPLFKKRCRYWESIST